MNAGDSSRFDRWMAELETRHLSELTFAEVSRSLRALSSTYVERRRKLSEGAALSGRGKRAAFALFYAPLHFLMLHEVALLLGEPFTAVRTLLELGCGTAAASAGWALACDRPPRISGIDRHPWAVDEARRTTATFGLSATIQVGDLRRFIGTPGRDQKPADAILLAYTVNELGDRDERDALLRWLMLSAERGSRVLIVEPLAGFVAPWWKAWQTTFETGGGAAREWRISVTLPAIVAKLDRAAGLRHDKLTARTLSI